MGNPFVVVIAETQKCSKDGCDGALYWDGSIALSANPQYTMTCRECGRRHNYAHDEDTPSKIRLVTTGEPNPSIEKLEVIEGEPKFTKLVEYFAYEELGIGIANIPEKWWDAPDDIVQAAYVLSQYLREKTFIAQKPVGGAGIKLPNTPDSGVWCITLKQDMYDGCYSVAPDGTIMETEQYT